MEKETKYPTMTPNDPKAAAFIGASKVNTTLNDGSTVIVRTEAGESTKASNSGIGNILGGVSASPTVTR